MHRRKSARGDFIIIIFTIWTSKHRPYHIINISTFFFVACFHHYLLAFLPFPVEQCLHLYLCHSGCPYFHNQCTDNRIHSCYCFFLQRHCIVLHPFIHSVQMPLSFQLCWYLHNPNNAQNSIILFSIHTQSMLVCQSIIIKNSTWQFNIIPS